MKMHEFKLLVSKCAKDIGYEYIRGAWFMESTESIIVLDLQKSNYGNYYYLNINIFVQGAFNKNYEKSKDLVGPRGTVCTRSPEEYNYLFDLDFNITDEERKSKMQEFFQNYLKLFSEKALRRKGIKELADEGEILLHEPVKETLGF